jgi:hypothetical protein
VLGWQAEGMWQLRAKKEALVLTAGCVWLLNGLHSAPDNGPASRSLMDCILPEVDRRGADEMFLAYGKAIDDDDDGDSTDNSFDTRLTLPANPHGIVFFCSIRLGESHPVPRLPKGKILTRKSFHYLFGIDFEDLDENYFTSTSAPSLSAPHRSSNRTRRTKRVRYDDDAPQQQLFHLRVRGVELAQPPSDDGSDLEIEGGEAEEPQGDVDRQLTDLWLQFIHDVTNKTANRRGANAEGYCKLTEEEKLELGDGMFKNLRLSTFFNDCQWRVGADNEWDAVFDHLFPLENKASSSQNYRSCIYYNKWMDIRDSAIDKETLKTIQRALRSKFSTLLWFPYAQAGRIWTTRVYRSRFKKFISEGQPAPWVVCRRQPSWN